MPDFVLLIMTFALVGFGIIMVYSASYIVGYSTPNYNDALYFFRRQVMWGILGVILLLISMNVPAHVYRDYFATIAIISFLALLLVFTPLGHKLNGARSWIRLGPLSFEPAEFSKLGLVLYLSGLIAKKKEAFRVWTNGLLPALVVTLTFFLAIAAQPAFGSAIILLFTAGFIIFTGGSKLKHLGIICIPILVGLVVIAVSAPYRLKRITTFLNPWNDGLNGLGDGYQLSQALYAIGHGGIWGVGFGKSIEKYMYLPYPQTDFIFPVIAEELGFIGCFLFIIFFICFLNRILFITYRTKDLFSILTGIGIVSMFAIQALMNIGGVTGSIPIAGVPLPFISYGGTSLLISMFSVGVVLSISRRVPSEGIK
ncbi:MAG TPA: putative lipid II flippase FtsW [Bacillota bacterium]|nr:putative lipid II flippase FtsW [Bacillota bacterium]